MRSINRKIDKFCWSHPKFGIPRLMMYIIIGNAVVWLFGQMDTTSTLYSLLYFDPALFCRGQIWRILTFALVPDSSGLLMLAIALYFYYFIGSSLEREWGAGKFTIYYFSGLIITALYSLIVYWIVGTRLLVSATYLNLSLFFAFATLWPDQRVLLFFFIPMKIKWLAWVDLALFGYEIIYCLVHGLVTLALVPVVAMLVYMLYCGDWLIDFFRPSRAQQRARTVKFKKEAKKIQRDQANQPYKHKCAVCGRTDADYPTLEFRYCSRCVGYHCFCQDHINNHIHFTE